MRLIFFQSAFFIMMLVSCDSRTKSRFDNIPKENVTCLNELNKAKTDIQNGRLIYCHFAGGMLYEPLRNAKEMDSLLNKFGIGYREEIISDLILEGQTQGCYCDYMKEVIDAKFNKTFIDSLLNLSDSLFVQNNINDTFDYTYCDTRPNYPGDTGRDYDDFSENFQKDLEKSIRYPKGYVKRLDDASAFADVHLYVDKNGNAYITSCWFRFEMKSNHNYEAYFQAEIEKALKNQGWRPAVIRNQKVNSDMVFRLHFE